MSQGIMYIERPADAGPRTLAGAKVMGYVPGVSSLFLPRVGILAFWFFGSRLGDAFSSWVIPVIGFLILPWTTLGYAMMWGISSDKVSGWEGGLPPGGARGGEGGLGAVCVLLAGATYVGARAAAKS